MICPHCHNTDILDIDLNADGTFCAVCSALINTSSKRQKALPKRGLPQKVAFAMKNAKMANVCRNELKIIKEMLSCRKVKSVSPQMNLFGEKK